MTFITLEQEAKAIVNTYAGSPIELQRQLKPLGITYTFVRRGALSIYVLRGAIKRTEIKL